MEGVGLAASITGLLTAIFKVGGFIQTMIDAPALVRDIRSEIVALRSIFHQLDEFIVQVSHSPPRHDSPAAQLYVEHFVAVLTGCVCSFSELDKELHALNEAGNEHGPGVWDRARWAIKEKDFRNILTALQNHKLSLQLMLTIYNCESQRKAQKTVQKVERLLLAILESDPRLAKRMDDYSRRLNTADDQSDVETVRPRTSSETDRFSLQTMSTYNRTRLGAARIRDLRSASGQFSFERTLSTTRVYARVVGNSSTASFRTVVSSESRWSQLSGVSLSNVSNISVFVLPVVPQELFNGGLYLENIAPTPDSMAAAVTSDLITNRPADRAQGIYQKCLILRERLRDVPDFEKFLQPPEYADPDMPEDPVTQLWRCFRIGLSLCVLFDATRPVELIIRDGGLSPDWRTINDCKAATFHFLKAIMRELDIQGDDAFMIHHLYSDDTYGFVKVTKTVTKILDILRERNLLSNRGETGTVITSSEKTPLDNRALVIQELVDTERRYVQDLESLQDYMRYLETNEVVSRDLIHNLFLNLNNLVDFQRRFLIQVEIQNELLPEKQNWGSLFVQCEISFSVYETYASNLNMAQELAVELREALEKFPHPVLGNLAALLIKPVQRVTNYPLLLQDLIKHTDPIAAEDQQLEAGLAVIERIAQHLNEAIRQSENNQQVKDLEGRVKDWKGHKLSQFGLLLLHGKFPVKFPVIKGDQKGKVEVEYHTYLFERLLLLGRESGVSKKGTKGSKTKYSARPNAPKTELVLKGRIFVWNIVEVISIPRNGSYVLQIFFRGVPGTQDFMIKHANEEIMQKWNLTLQKQIEQYQRPRSRSGRSSPPIEFQWLSVDCTEDYSHDSDTEDDDDDPATVTCRETGLSAVNRSGSSSGRPSRSRTVVSFAQAPGLPSPPRPPSSRYVLPGLIPPTPTLPTSYSTGAHPDHQNGTISHTFPPMARINPEAESPAVMPRSSSEQPPNTPTGSLLKTSSKSSIVPNSLVKVNLHYNNDKHAIIIPYNIGYTQLLERIKRKVHISKNTPRMSPTTPIRIRYRDEDGDFITMWSDDDVPMAFDVSYEPGQADSGREVALYVSVG